MRIYKFRRVMCQVCGHTKKALAWEDRLPWHCDQVMVEDAEIRGEAPAVIGDEMDSTIRNGICNADGSPRRYRSRADMRDAMKATGWVHPDGSYPGVYHKGQR